MNSNAPVEETEINYSGIIEMYSEELDKIINVTQLKQKLQQLGRKIEQLVKFRRLMEKNQPLKKALQIIKEYQR